MRTIFSLLSACIIFVFTACDSDSKEVLYMQVSDTDLALLQQPFLVEANSRTVAVATNLSVVKVETSESWCMASVLENNGIQLRVAVFPNDGFTERTAQVKLYGKGAAEIVIPVTQLSSTPSMVVSTNEVSIADGDLEFDFLVTCNYDFTLVLPSWIKDNGENTPEIGTKRYFFIADPMAPGIREGSIELKPQGGGAGLSSKWVNVQQTQSELSPQLQSFQPTLGKKGAEITLIGSRFGNLIEEVQVFFNDLPAQVKSVSDEAIVVYVPTTPGDECTIKLIIAGKSYTYTEKFTYEKSWFLTTVTGNGTPTFKAGTLAEGQIRARYLTIDANDNLFAINRETTNDLFVAKISEKDNSIVSLTGSAPLKTPVKPYVAGDWTPNAACVGPNNVLYVPNDLFNATSYYTLDPKDNWTPQEHTVTYAGTAPPTDCFLYRLIYHNGYLYGVAGHARGIFVKINPNTHAGEILYEWGAHPYCYALGFNPAKPNELIGFVNSGAVGYGPWTLDTGSPSNRFVRLNSSAALVIASAATLKDGPLVSATFGRAYEFAFGPDGAIYVTDEVTHVIRKVDLVNQTVETVVGLVGVSGAVDGDKDTATLHAPRGIVWNKDGTALYISETGGNRIRKWSFE